MQPCGEVAFSRVKDLPAVGLGNLTARRAIREPGLAR